MSLCYANLSKCLVIETLLLAFRSPARPKTGCTVQETQVATGAAVVIKAPDLRGLAHAAVAAFSPAIQHQ